MNDGEVIGAASENLLATYRLLGLAVSGARELESEEFVSCTGPLDHPICNFAARLRLDPWSARRLRDLALSRRSFAVYALPGDEPSHLSELLVRAGFQNDFRLTQMVSVRPEPGPIVETLPARTAEERHSLADFMTGQFFSRQSETFRQKIAMATSRAEQLELHGVWERGQPIASVMLCRTEAVLGVYNLCVSASRRGQGIGSGIISGLLAGAMERSEIVTLQCDARLEAWYGCQGFSTTGNVDVYSLAKREVDVIIC